MAISRTNRVKSLIKKSFVSASSIIIASVYTCLGALLALKLAPIFFFSVLSYAPFTIAAAILVATATVCNKPEYFIAGAKKLTNFAIDSAKYGFNTAKDVGEKLAQMASESINTPAFYIAKSYTYVIGKYSENIGQIKKENVNLKNIRNLIKKAIINVSGLVLSGLATYAAISLGVAAIPYFMHITLTTYPIYVAAGYLGVLAYARNRPNESAEKIKTFFDKTTRALYAIPQTGQTVGVNLARTCLESEVPAKSIKYAFDGFVNASKNVSKHAYSVATQCNSSMRQFVARV